jgi:hypothetical protein
LIDGRSLGAIADLSSQHAVLAIGYSTNGNIVTIEAYDPNYPRNEIRLRFTLARTGVSETFMDGRPINRRPPRGVMFVHGVHKPHSWYASYSGTSSWQDLTTSHATVDEVRIGDFNGDRKADVFATWKGKWHVSWGGTSRWEDLNTSDATVSQVLFGDFGTSENDPLPDGKADVFAAWGGRWRVSYGGTSAWHIINTSDATVSQVLLGDFGTSRNDNSPDGKADVFAAWGGKWHVSWGGTSRWQDLNTSDATVSQVLFGDFGTSENDPLPDGKADVFAAR